MQSHDTTCLCGPVYQNRSFILNGCGDIFDEKVLRNYGRTDGRTDRCKPVYSPLIQSGEDITIAKYILHSIYAVNCLSAKRCTLNLQKETYSLDIEPNNNIIAIAGIINGYEMSLFVKIVEANRLSLIADPVKCELYRAYDEKRQTLCHNFMQRSDNIEISMM